MDPLPIKGTGTGKWQGMMRAKLANPFPANVRKIGIPAPASMPKVREMEEARRLLEGWGIEPAMGENVFSGADERYLAASDEARLADLNALIADESVDLILCARGGYGSMRILDGIDWKTLKRRRLPLLGYSDITAIHLAMLTGGAGVPIVSPMANSLRKTVADPFTANAFKRAVNGANGGFKALEAPAGKPKIEALRKGSAAGPVIPANLTLLASLAGTKFMPRLSGAILVVEDIGEKPRSIDRMLAQLELSGALDEVAALVFGDFKDCGTEEELSELMRNYAKKLDGPVLRNLPFGHLIPTLSFRMGEEGVIEKGQLLLRK